MLFSLKALDQTWKLDGAYSEEQPVQNIDYNTLVISITERGKRIKELEEKLGIVPGDHGQEIIEAEIGKPKTKVSWSTSV